MILTSRKDLLTIGVSLLIRAAARDSAGRLLDRRATAGFYQISDVFDSVQRSIVGLERPTRTVHYQFDNRHTCERKHSIPNIRALNDE